MKKTIPAFIAALLITLVLGGGMFLMGQDALGTSTAKADAAASAQVSNVTAAQYEQVVSQYQAREAQYQEMIAQASRQNRPRWWVSAWHPPDETHSGFR